MAKTKTTTHNHLREEQIITLDSPHSLMTVCNNALSLNLLSKKRRFQYYTFQYYSFYIKKDKECVHICFLLGPLRHITCNYVVIAKFISSWSRHQ